MSKKTFFSAFFNAPLFTRQALINVSERVGISKNTLHAYIQRSIAEKELVPLKRGTYVTHEFLSQNRSKLDYVFCIATKLLEPSYVSLESALQYYGLLTEANTSVITCVSTSITRRFKNRLGIFEYRSIKDNLFTDYKNIREEFDFYIAEPHKAIFDYLYFRLPRKDLREKNKVIGYLNEFRIDYESLKASELKKLFTLISTL